VMGKDQPFTAILHRMQYLIFHFYPEIPGKVIHMLSLFQK